jgi:hypothetical protein
LHTSAPFGDTPPGLGGSSIAIARGIFDRIGDTLAGIVRWLEARLDAMLPGNDRARAVVIGLVVLVCLVVPAALSLRSSGSRDFAVYFLAAASFLSGQPVYGLNLAHLPGLAKSLGIEVYSTPYFYPPLTAVLVSPLALLPFKVATLVWGIINGAAVIAGSALLLGERRWQRESLVIWLLIASFVPSLTSL